MSKHRLDHDDGGNAAPRRKKQKLQEKEEAPVEAPVEEPTVVAPVYYVAINTSKRPYRAASTWQKLKLPESSYCFHAVELVGVEDDMDAEWQARDVHKQTGAGANRRCKHHSEAAMEGWKLQKVARAASRRSLLRERTKYEPPKLSVGCPGTKSVGTDRCPFVVTAVSDDCREISVSNCSEPLTWRMYSNRYVEKSKTIAYQVSCRVCYSFGVAVSYTDPHF